MERRLVVTICPRERGVVVLPVERGGTPRSLDAGAVTQCLRELVVERQLEGRVSFVEGCAGGCSGAGPNVGVTMYAMPRPGLEPDNVAVGWRTYVYSLPSQECLAAVIEDNLNRP